MEIEDEKPIWERKDLIPKIDAAIIASSVIRKSHPDFVLENDITISGKEYMTMITETIRVKLELESEKKKNDGMKKGFRNEMDSLIEEIRKLSVRYSK